MHGARVRARAAACRVGLGRAAHARRRAQRVEQHVRDARVRRVVGPRVEKGAVLAAHDARALGGHHLLEELAAALIELEGEDAAAVVHQRREVRRLVARRRARVDHRRARRRRERDGREARGLLLDDRLAAADHRDAAHVRLALGLEHEQVGHIGVAKVGAVARVRRVGAVEVAALARERLACRAHADLERVDAHVARQAGQPEVVGAVVLVVGRVGTLLRHG